MPIQEILKLCGIAPNMYVGAWHFVISNFRLPISNCFELLPSSIGAAKRHRVHKTGIVSWQSAPAGRLHGIFTFLHPAFAVAVNRTSVCRSMENQWRKRRSLWLMSKNGSS
jgi:hypothetical protein